MSTCNGINKKGSKCNAIAHINGYCRWHAECPICLERFTKDDKPLPCKHWVHRGCIQKSADAMQDLRQDEGYPPLRVASCPICRAPVPEIKPKEREQLLKLTHILELGSNILNRIYNEWYQASTNRVPLCFYIWVALYNKYPNYAEPHMLVLAAEIFEEFIFDGIVTVSLYPENDQSQNDQSQNEINSEDENFQNEIDQALDAINSEDENFQNEIDQALDDIEENRKANFV